MGKEVNNFKDLLSYCSRTNTYAISKVNNLVYLENGEILKIKKVKNHV